MFLLLMCINCNSKEYAVMVYIKYGNLSSKIDPPIKILLQVHVRALFMTYIEAEKPEKPLDTRVLQMTS